MMKFDGPALESIREALGLTGVGAQITEFPDGVCDQVLDVAPFIRRGRTFAGSSGLFGGRITNTHAGAGALLTTVDPYAVTAPGSGYPSPVPPGYDVWLLSSWASAVIGVQSATLASRLTISHPATNLAFGSAGGVGQLVRLFLGESAISATLAFLRESAGSVQPSTYPVAGWRIPRGSTIVWATNAAIAGDLIVELLIGLFPAGMGQDGRV